MNCKGLPLTTPSTRRNERSKASSGCCGLCQTNIWLWKLRISNRQAVAWTTQMWPLVNLLWYTKKKKTINFFLRYKDGKPLIMSHQPWNYRLQQKFGLNSLEIRRWVTSSNPQITMDILVVEKYAGASNAHSWIWRIKKCEKFVDMIRKFLCYKTMSNWGTLVLPFPLPKLWGYI